MVLCAGPLEVLQESSEPGWASFSSPESRRKGALETRSGDEPPVPAAPLVASLMGTVRVWEEKLKMCA